MYVKAQKMAFSGLLVSVSVILIVLASVFETSTFFLLAAAAFCVGIAVREWGLRWGAAFLAACGILGAVLSPNKIYVLSFVMLGVYIWLREAGWELLARTKRIQNRKAAWWIWKYTAFNLLYLPVFLFFPSLFLARKVTGMMFAGFAAAGQVGLFIFDTAYTYFQAEIWAKLRGKLCRR